MNLLNLVTCNIEPLVMDILWCSLTFLFKRTGLELREDIDTVLQENMVISMEPMILIPEGKAGAGGYREHDILVIGKNGSENISKFPLGPEHNIVKG